MNVGVKLPTTYGYFVPTSTSTAGWHFSKAVMVQYHVLPYYCNAQGTDVQATRCGWKSKREISTHGRDGDDYWRRWYWETSISLYQYQGEKKKVDLRFLLYSYLDNNCNWFIYIWCGSVECGCSVLHTPQTPYLSDSITVILAFRTYRRDCLRSSLLVQRSHSQSRLLLY